MKLKTCGILLTILIFLGCSKEPEIEEVIRPVVTTVVEEPPTAIERSFSGVAQGVLDTKLSFRVSGEIIRLQARIGLRVKEGDVIAQLEPTDYELKVEQARANLAQVRAQFVQADADYTRSKALYENANISKSALDASRASFNSAKAQVDATKKQLEQAEQQLSYTVLNAPQEGTIGEVPVEINQVIQAGRMIASLVSEEKIEMEVGIPEALITKVNEGDNAFLRFDTVADEPFPAEVTKVSVDASSSSTYVVKLAMLTEDSRIRPGMIGEATLIFNTIESERYILLPPMVVAGRLDERYIWIFDKGSESVTRRDIVPGELTSAGLQIKGGVTPGERVVTRGVHRLEEGMKVKLLKN